MNIVNIQGPKSTSFNDRIEWAGERYADIAEGKISLDDGWFIWQWVMGWRDLCDNFDRAGYTEMANRISDLLHGMKNG